MRSTTRAIALLLLACPGLAGASGCSLHDLTVDEMAITFRDAKGAFERERSIRHAREAAPALLSTIDGVLAGSPENEDLLLLSAEMNASFAFAFIEREDAEWARELYRKSRDRGFRLLEIEHPGIARALRETPVDRLGATLARFDEDDLPALFWTAFAWAGIVNTSLDDMGAVSDLPRIKAIVGRVFDLDPRHAFHFGGADICLGAMTGSRGELLGADFETSKRHFERAIQATGGRFLMAKVVMAERYAIPAQDRETFERLLREVLDAPEDIFPEQTLANRIARARAEALLPQADDLFLPPLPPDEEEPPRRRGR